jgi:hypothetical protein
MVHDFTWAADKDYIHDVADLTCRHPFLVTNHHFRTGKFTTKKQITVNGDLQQNCYIQAVLRNSRRRWQGITCVR